MVGPITGSFDRIWEEGEKERRSASERRLKKFKKSRKKKRDVIKRKKPARKGARTDLKSPFANESRKAQRHLKK